MASYPKSGNTLVRSLLSSYFFSTDGKFNFDLLESIKQFPNNDLFKKFGIDVRNEEELVKNYIKIQTLINKNRSTQF